ncbi:hypothetical protein BDZ88DRAFT_455200 [Geranomyces variabilis]|nr:hypothetical protein BDZ88DRAFT_455200 [Geranomyces variabilis]KAJ3139942.1 hypothetical protein HDU90_008843 [Geranomyces variabilis]
MAIINLGYIHLPRRLLALAILASLVLSAMCVPANDAARVSRKKRAPLPGSSTQAASAVPAPATTTTIVAAALEPVPSPLPDVVDSVRSADTSINWMPGMELFIPPPQELSAEQTTTETHRASDNKPAFSESLNVGMANHSATLHARELYARADVASVGLKNGPYVCSKGSTSANYMAVWSPDANYTNADDIFAVCNSRGLYVASITSSNIVELTAVARSCGASQAVWVTTYYQDIRILVTSGSGTAGALSYNYRYAGPWPVLCALPVPLQCASSRVPTVVSFDDLALTTNAATGVKAMQPSGAAVFQSSTGLSITALKSNGSAVGDSILMDVTTIPVPWGQRQRGLASGLTSPNVFLSLFGSYLSSTKGTPFDVGYLFVTGTFTPNDRLLLSDASLNADGSLKNTSRTLDVGVSSEYSSLLRVGWTGVKALLFPESVIVDQMIICL